MATATRQPVADPPASGIKRDAGAVRGQQSLLALWHLLSLDAPTVAALWTWFIGRVNHIALPGSSILAMAVAVWMLYAADRLMDARVLDASFMAEDDLEARHYFHHRHRSVFLAGIAVASVALAVLLRRLDMRAIRLYCILGVLRAGYFIVIHSTRRVTAIRKVAQRLPKEIAVGVFFAAAAFIPAVARRPDLRLTLLPLALLFAALCSLNCLFIYAWEHSGLRSNQPIHIVTRVALRHLILLSIGISVAGLVCMMATHYSLWPLSLACALSAILLLVLHYCRSAIAPVTLRAAADLALLTPLLLLCFLR